MSLDLAALSTLPSARGLSEFEAGLVNAVQSICDSAQRRYEAIEANLRQAQELLRQAEAERDALIERIDALESRAADIIAAEPEKVVAALRQWLTADSAAVANALRSTVRSAGGAK